MSGQTDERADRAVAPPSQSNAPARIETAENLGATPCAKAVMNLNSVQSALVNTASAAVPGSVQGSAALSILKKSMVASEGAAAQLIAALPQVPRAASGGLGVMIDVYV